MRLAEEAKGAAMASAAAAQDAKTEAETAAAAAAEAKVEAEAETAKALAKVADAEAELAAAAVQSKSTEELAPETAKAAEAEAGDRRDGVDGVAQRERDWQRRQGQAAPQAAPALGARESPGALRPRGIGRCVRRCCGGGVLR